MSSGPEAEAAVEVSTVEGGRLGHTLVLLLSRREMPDTSRKPEEERRSPVLRSQKTATGNLGAWLPGHVPGAPNLPLAPQMPST